MASAHPHPPGAGPDPDVWAQAEPVPGVLGPVAAWTTTRAMGSFGFSGREPVHAVWSRWEALTASLRARGCDRVASGVQVHGADVARQGPGWQGLLRQHGVDGHVTDVPGTALVVTVADCTPVFVSHPRGVVALLHAGWRGTAAGILGRGLALLDTLGCPPSECAVHLGPSICGSCYEVGPEVLAAVTGRPASRKGLLDVRAVLGAQARAAGVRELSVSPWCTRCHHDRFFSHRGGDEGRQLGIIALAPDR